MTSPVLLKTIVNYSLLSGYRALFSMRNVRKINNSKFNDEGDLFEEDLFGTFEFRLDNPKFGFQNFD